MGGNVEGTRVGEEEEGQYVGLRVGGLVGKSVHTVGAWVGNMVGDIVGVFVPGLGVEDEESPLPRVRISLL